MIMCYTGKITSASMTKLRQGTRVQARLQPGRFPDAEQETWILRVDGRSFACGLEANLQWTVAS